MQKNRRQFILGTGAAFVASAFERIAASDAPVTASQNIRTLLQSSGFNPDDPNSNLMAIIGDVHINLDSSDAKFTDHLDDHLVAELNSLEPSITDLTIVGDLIVHHSVSIGGNRYPSHYELSRLEFRAAKAQLARFRPGMNVRAVPGNHDTDRYESNAELWREELQLPPYQKAVIAGVPVFFMNSGHAGMLDPAQIAWFENEVRSIPNDQEVLIIAHHPSFYYVFEEIGLKRVVHQAFYDHGAPIWLVGGHGHSFSEQLLVSGKTPFIQSEVPTANPKQWGDGHSPGYILLALQDGRVVQRIFRAVNESRFEKRAPLQQLRSFPIKWPFDDVEWPAAVFEEGAYDRTGRLIDFVGTDLRSHITGCRSYTVKVDLSKVGGKIDSFLLSANISPSLVPSTCYFSTTGPGGPWVGVSLPAGNSQQIYRIPIPPELRASPNLYITTKTQLQGLYDGITIYGWGLAAAPSKLTGYEKWLSTQYQTIFLTTRTDPNTKPAGSSLNNIEHFAFNIPLPSSATSDLLTTSPPSNQQIITGLPSYSRSFRQVMSYRFARRTAISVPQIAYAVESSTDLVNWTLIDESQLTITSLDADWEEVRLNILTRPGFREFYRTKISTLQDGPGSSTHITSGDLDADGIDDLLEYAFDLQTLRPYDPNRPTHKAGIPLQNNYSELCSVIRYPRLHDPEKSGVIYRIEETDNLREWKMIPKTNFAEKVIRSNGVWDEIEVIIMDSKFGFRFYRVCLDLNEQPST